MNSKIAALEIIFLAPLWPKREMLSESGMVLHDAIVETAKPYAMALVSEKYEDAFAIASKWTKPLNDFIDNTHIGQDENNHRMLRVYDYYVSQIADFSRIAA
jgi:glycyl-tRNA synthetase beta subunit